MARRPIIEALVKRIKGSQPIVGAILDGLRNAAADPAAAIQSAQVDASAVEHVRAAIEASPDVAVVEVKSGWLSKINRTQVIGLAVTGLAWVGLDITAEQLLAVFAGVQAIVAVVTVVFKTFFSPSVTPQSASKPA